MTRFPYGLLCATAVALGGCARFTGTETRTAQLTILHWNDFHAHNVPYLAAAKGQAREEHSMVGGSATLLSYMNQNGRGQPHVAVVFAGDDFQGPPVSGITQGESQIELMNTILPDVTTLGNHEFDYGLENLRSKIARAQYPILAANLYDSSAGTTFRPAAAVKRFGDVRVGFIGLLPPDLPILTMKSTLAGTRMLDVDSVLTSAIGMLKHREKAELIVLVSHMGVQEDTLLARRRNDIDIIVGGHTHTALFTPLKVGRTIVVQAGSHGRHLGRLDCVVDLRGDSVAQYRGWLIETKAGVFPPDSTLERKVRHFEALVDDQLNQVIGTLVSDWRTSLDAECNTGNWQADAFRAFAGADIAVINSGGLRKSMFAGPIRRRDIWEMNPFGNSLTTFRITGEHLLRLLEWQAAGKGEFMQVSGLRYSYDPEKPLGQRVLTAFVGDLSVERERVYTGVTNNYVAGHAAELLGIDLADQNDLGVVDRDILIDTIIRTGNINAAIDGRIHNTRTFHAQELPR